MTNSDDETGRNQLIKRLKVHRVSLFSVLVGIVLLFVANMDFIQHLVGLVEWIKLVGGTLIVAGIVTGTYELMVREETQRQMAESVQSEIRKVMNEMQVRVEQRVASCVAQTLLLDRKVQKEVLASGKINEVMLTCLSTKLGEEMSEELLSDVINPILDAFESTKQRVMYDYNLRIQLEESKEPNVAKSFYLLRLMVEYRYVLRMPQFRFACVTSHSDFQDLLDDPTFTYTYFLPNSMLPEIRFDVSDIKLQYEGRAIPLQKMEGKKSKEVKEISFGSFELPQYVGKECKLFYKISTIIRKDGHMYFVRIKHPIRNLIATFDSGNTSITHVSVSDQFVSSGGVVLHEEIVGGKITKIVSVDGWVFPNSGVTFVWHQE